MLAHAAPAPTRSESQAPADDLRAEAEERLRRSGYLALRDVTCDASAGQVSLGGRLPSYYLKQLAQSIIGDIVGVTSVHNEIVVDTPSRRPEGGLGPSQARAL
jgi:hypothetical protein